MNDEKSTPEITGNDFIDAYNLGYEAGKREKQQEVENAEKRCSDNYWRAAKAEKRVEEANQTIERLRAKNRKLKKLLKAGE